MAAVKSEVSPSTSSLSARQWFSGPCLIGRGLLFCLIVLSASDLVSQPIPTPAPKPGFRGSDAEDRGFGPNLNQKMQELVNQGFLTHKITPKELASVHSLETAKETGVSAFVYMQLKKANRQDAEDGEVFSIIGPWRGPTKEQKSGDGEPAAADARNAGNREPIPAVSRPGNIQGSRKWTTHDGRQFEGAFVGFDVRVFKLYRLRGKLYIDGTEYDKLPEYGKYSVDRTLSLNGVGNAEQLARQLRGAPRMFSYPVVRFSNVADGKVFVVSIHLLAAEHITALSGPYQTWRERRLREIAAKKEAERAKRRGLRKGISAGRVYSGYDSPSGGPTYSSQQSGGTSFSNRMSDGSYMHSGPGGTSFSNRMSDGSYMHSGPGGTSFSNRMPNGD